MIDFQPTLSTRLLIHSNPYEFLPHPILPGEIQRIVRDRATIYQLRRHPDGTLWALKVSNPGYRDPLIAQKVEHFQQFRNLPGLRVANRICLTRAMFPELIGTYPSLENAVLMPWIQGPTWAGFMDDATMSATYSMSQALELALTLAYTLWSLESNRLTHTDISGDNVIVINPKRVEFIDIDGLYIYGTPPPAQPSRGWRGYQHPNLDQRGHCRPEGDRYAGAILLTEMLTWWKPLVRALTEGESLFQLGMREQPELLKQRLKVVRSTLREIHPILRQLFIRAWSSNDLVECPDAPTWVMALLQARSGY
jgi:hypothetical protein